MFRNIFVGLRKQLVRSKNRNILLQIIWLEYIRLRGWVNLSYFDDEAAIRKLYRDYSGRELDLNAPLRFSEKMQWIKLYARNPQQTICADKHAVRAWLTERGYGHLLNNQIAVYDKVSEINFDALPNQFVLKAAHASGWNLICRDKRKLPIWQVRLLLRAWLRQNIFWNGREWPYRDMPHRIVCESYLEDNSGGLRDFKFYCFNGEPRFVQANAFRGDATHVQNFYGLDWSILPFGKELAPKPEVQLERPESLDEMITIARELSHHFDYVRVDFYEVNGKPVFGEFTFFPASGLPDFVPDSYDFVCGDMLTISTVKS